MYPDVIIYKKNLKIERLKTQGLSTYEVNTDQLYVLYSIYLDIKLGDIIYLNLSEIKINWSMIYWSHQQEKQIIKSKKIYKQLFLPNDYILNKKNLYIFFTNFDNSFLRKLYGNYQNVTINLINNTGGKISEMIECLSIFLKNDIIFKVLNLDSFQIEFYDVRALNKIKFKDLFVVINHTTYSSAEFFSSLLKKEKNVKVFGDSFGKDCIYKKIKENGKIIYKKQFFFWDKFFLILVLILRNIDNAFMWKEKVILVKSRRC